MQWLNRYVFYYKNNLSSNFKSYQNTAYKGSLNLTQFTNNNFDENFFAIVISIMSDWMKWQIQLGASARFFWIDDISCECGALQTMTLLIKNENTNSFYCCMIKTYNKICNNVLYIV